MIYGTISKNDLLDDGLEDDRGSGNRSTVITSYHKPHQPSTNGMNDSNDDQVVIHGNDHGDHRDNCQLPPDFVPGPNDVVCARGKSYWDHEGNKRYRALIGSATEKYSASTNKLEKTLIVSEIVQSVHQQKGCFVKKERKGGPWVVVDEVFAREKVGQSLRDGLHDKYRSSTKAKKQRRACVNEKFNGDIDRVIHSNRIVSQRIEDLTREVKKNGALASDFSIITLFSRANSDILETIKKDSSMLNQFQDATVAANIDAS